MSSYADKAELARLLRSVRLPHDRRAVVPAVLNDVTSVLQASFPGCKAELFGSILAGIPTIWSDVDVSISLGDEDTNTPSSLLVRKARDIMQCSKLFEVIMVISDGRIPVLNVKHLPSGFIVDICFRGNDGVLKSELVYHLMNLDSRARDLALIIKHWAHLNGITGSTKVSISNYAIVSMVIFFLQQKGILPPIANLQKNHEKHIINYWDMGFVKENYAITNVDSLSSLLGGFFKYYAEFDYSKYVISPFIGWPFEIELFRDVETVPKEFYQYKTNVSLETTDPLLLDTPLILDSFEHNNNLADRVTGIPRSTNFVISFQCAAEKFEEGCLDFLM